MSAEIEAIALGASAGGLRPLLSVLNALPAELPASVFVAQHRAPTSTEMFIRLLQRATALRVREASEGEAAMPGAVYIAPAGRHLEVTPAQTLSVARSGRIGHVCPSADLLFCSLAACYGARACAVVLSGNGRDGAEGVCAVRAQGGFVIAQDQATSACFSMPCSAIETRKVDLVLPADRIGYALGVLAGAAMPRFSPRSPEHGHSSSAGARR